ncbi:MAG: rRNA maturation RNase YbeY [Candidatus Dormibacteraeota bacterium]|nr:rRNA maturation RNase YbeY [Candidatus Dormibacteraeota bacterium]
MGVAVAVSVVKAVPAPIAPAVLRSVLAAAAAEPAVAARLGARPLPARLTVRLTGDREMRRLNRSFLGEDASTDVLSFPSIGPGEAARSGYLGDLAVGWPAVRRQAAAFGETEVAEAALLIVHGFLHLLGWDHATPAEEGEMWALTRRCLVLGGFSLSAGRLAGGPAPESAAP